MRRLLSVLGLALCASASALTVKVDPAGGAPRIVVDGQPVRARIFWGAPGHARLPVSNEWRTLSFDFVAASSATNGTLHFRFGQTVGTVELDNLHVTEADTGREILPLCDFETGPESFTRQWTFWPNGAANTVGRHAVDPGAGRDGTSGLRVELKAPPNKVWPDYHIYHLPRLAFVHDHRYHVTFDARATPARPLEIAFYQPGERYMRLGGPTGVFERQVQLAATAGVNFVSFPMDLPWPKPGQQADRHNAEAACRTVLAANPRALLLPRIPMNPPPWWREAHPDETMQWEDGRRDAAVPASPLYRRDAAQQLAALIEHLEKTFGDHIAGYHPVGQNTGEWFYENTWNRPLNGFAPADQVAWRVWLAAKYTSDAALRSAWHSTNATWAAATVPTAAARHAAPAGVFRDPVAEQPLIDWAAFQQEAMADCVCALAKAARTASGGKKLVLFFYGYGFEFGAVPTGPTVSGHYALRRVLECPDVDILCSPISYFDRGLGGSAPSMTAAESVALAGKLWLNEDDTHTYLATEQPPGWDAHVGTIEETNQELVRNTAQAALRNFGTWWMDLCASGWFNDERMWTEMTRLRGLDEALLRAPSPFRPEVAAILDERSMAMTSARAVGITRPGIYEVRSALGRMGAPYGQYLLDDVLADRVHAKLYVFLNAWQLSATERAALLRATRGSARLWCHAPGYFDGMTSSLPAMRELTGFDLRERPRGGEGSVHPQFTPANANPEEVLARYPDGAPSVTLRRTAEGVSVFCGKPGLTPELLRTAARAAGVHLFTQTNCNVYANGPFLALHASQDGPLEVDFGKAGDVMDALTGEKFGRGPKLVLPLRRGETRVLKY